MTSLPLAPQKLFSVGWRLLFPKEMLPAILLFGLNLSVLGPVSWSACLVACSLLWGHGLFLFLLDILVSN